MLPAMFIGHGNPMNALAENAYTARWKSLGVETPRPQSDSLDFRALVRSWNWGHGKHRTADDSRFWRISRGVISSAISGTWRSGLGPAGAETTPTLARSVGQLLGFGPRHMVGALPCVSAS